MKKSTSADPAGALLLVDARTRYRATRLGEEALAPRIADLHRMDGDWRNRAARLRGYRMSDTPPDRLSVDPDSPHHDSDAINRGVGIRFNGGEKTNVEEYSVSEGWIKVAAGKTLDRKGKPLTLKLSGVVEPYWRDAEG